MDPISHDTFKRVVSAELTKYYEQNPATIRWESTRNYYGDYINTRLIDSHIDSWLEHVEDPLHNNYNDQTVYQLLFDIFSSISQNADGEEYDVEDNMAKHLRSEVQREARNDKARGMGIDDDQHDILDI